ncbi:MAG: hypothetical protein ACRD1N_10450 [Terriglobia bacterium]
MEKGESVISIALTALLVLIVLGIQRRWSGSTITNIASSAENFVLQSTGIRGRIPQLAGYETVRTYRLGNYSAALYRASPAPLVFASFRFVLYGTRGQPVFTRNSVEATTAPWTRLYDFAGRHGLPDPRKRGQPVYMRDLSGDGSPDLVLGQYSGGDHCCTAVTVIELKDGTASILGVIGGLDGLPFEGLEIHRLDRKTGWQLVVHRPYRTACGSHPDAADVVAVYAYDQGKFVDQTRGFPKFLDTTLQANLAKWEREKNPSLHLLQTIAADYSQAGRPAMATQFFQENLPIFFPQLESNGANPQACTEDVSNLIKNISSGKAGS